MIFIVFILGLAIGSFLNVCIVRIPKEESIIYPQSHCANCGEKIKFYDLIPLLSYILLKGRCRQCNTKISIRYLLVEIFTAINFLILYWIYGLSFQFIKYGVFICFLLVIGIIDFYTTDVYSKIIFFGLVCSISFIIIEKNIYNNEILTYVYGGIISLIVFTLIVLITEGMGWGDVQIFAICGLYLGIKLTILMTIISFIVGSIICIIRIIVNKENMKRFIPFGPCITIASIITILLGENIINKYIYMMF